MHQVTDQIDRMIWNREREQDRLLAQLRKPAVADSRCDQFAAAPIPNRCQGVGTDGSPCYGVTGDCR